MRVTEKLGRFRANRSCIYQVFAVRQIVEKTVEKRRVVFVEFIELKEAYDSVISVQLWEAFRRGEVGQRLVRAIQSLYEECEARVKV